MIKYIVVTLCFPVIILSFAWAAIEASWIYGRVLFDITVAE